MPESLDGYVTLPPVVVATFVGAFALVVVCFLNFIRDMTQENNNRAAEKERMQWRLYERGLKLGRDTHMDCLQEQQILVRYRFKRLERKDCVKKPPPDSPPADRCDDPSDVHHPCDCPDDSKCKRPDDFID